MDWGAIQWVIITVVGVALLGIAIAFAMARNRSSREVIAKSEAATRDLYREEDAAHRGEDDGRV